MTSADKVLGMMAVDFLDLDTPDKVFLVGVFLLIHVIRALMEN